MTVNMPGIHFREENTDLYHCLPWSHGSLAFLVGLKLKIIPTKPYIHMKWVDLECGIWLCLIGDLRINGHVEEFSSS